MRSTWQALAACFLAVGLAHLVQPVLLPWRGKFWLALPGAVLYGCCAVGAWREHCSVLPVTAVGPVLGGALIAFGPWLSGVGLAPSGLAPDAPQLAVGALQFPAAVLAWRLWRPS
jgi:hypothetical protein